MVKGKYLIAKPRDQKDKPDPKKVKAKISEYQLFGLTIFTKISYIEEVEL